MDNQKVNGGAGESAYDSKVDKLAVDVLLLSRNTLLVNLRFMDLALSMLHFRPAPAGFADPIPEDDPSGLAVDGRRIFYDAGWVLKNYKEEKEAITRDYLHMVLHCVFHHSFVDSLVNQEAWDLACDIAVEAAINELNLPSTNARRSVYQRAFIESIREEVKILSAEKIYHYLLMQELLPEQLNEWRKKVMADDHALWYLPKPVGDSMAEGESDEDGNTEGEGQSGGGAAKSSLEDEWKQVSSRMQTDLETFSKNYGDKANNMTQNLKAVTRERYDYADFLRRFATMGESLKINDDEFDYIFYTYGMQMYDKMPLIEPLEYKELKKIREFVIAIDTSGSCSGAVVQKFIQKTYNILKQQESFFTKINLHIIMCDAEIQSDVKITSQEDFDRYMENMVIRGLGGTDFRPVFDYVEQLRMQKEFTDLKGLIYFTDGWGPFPRSQPDYNTAFVFLDNDYNNPDVPVWAIKLVLSDDDIL